MNYAGAADESYDTSKDNVQARVDDGDLIRRAQAGDMGAFGDLVDLHQRLVYGIVSRMVASRDEVDDLVQDIFIAAFGNIRKFRGDSKFSTWLHTIAVNMTLKRLKKMKRQSAISIDDPLTGLSSTLCDGDGHSPADTVQKRQQDEAVRKAIDTLPDKQRVVVVMHYFEHCSCEEIAAALKCSVGTVWSRLHYACRKLKIELDWLEQGA
jgi:RNA polymerase sigma-70 factor (ECF subfamily)